MLKRILKSRSLSPSMLLEAVHHIAGLPREDLHVVFNRVSPQWRMIKRLVKSSKELLKTNRDLTEKLVLALMPYIANYRSGKKMVKRILMYNNSN